MENHSDIPRALFLSRDSRLVPDRRVCSGELDSRLGGRPCPYSDRGRFPIGPRGFQGPALPASQFALIPDRLPVCLDRPMGKLGDWLQAAPSDSGVAQLQVFRCRQMFLLVIPGLSESPTGVQAEPGPGA